MGRTHNYPATRRRRVNGYERYNSPLAEVSTRDMALWRSLMDAVDARCPIQPFTRERTREAWRIRCVTAAGLQSFAGNGTTYGILRGWVETTPTPSTRGREHAAE